MPDDPPKLIAYTVGDRTLDIVPAPVRRQWMDSTPEKFANRCLPLLISNQSGWYITSKHKIGAIWNGGRSPLDVRIKVFYDDETHAPSPVSSHFGSGVLTWNMPWLFRTPPGWDLMVKGPCNLPKRGISPLEGVVETDWSPMTFTMNWVFTEPMRPVVFRVGEPVCMIAPVRRGELESFVPEIHDIADDPELKVLYDEWWRGRDDFHKRMALKDPEAIRQGWQKDYFRGRGGTGEHDHVTKRSLAEFREVPRDI